jgi:hypothetical protein
LRGWRAIAGCVIALTLADMALTILAGAVLLSLSFLEDQIQCALSQFQLPP